MRLKIKWNDGERNQNQILSVDAKATAGDLLRRIAQATGFPVENIQVKGGYPLKPVLTSEDALCVNEIKEGTALNVTAVAGKVKNEPKIGDVVKIEIPADNSCLFMSVAYIFMKSRDADAGRSLRQVVAEAVKKDKDRWSEPVLERKPEDYVNYILDDNKWGGFIDLVILSEKFGTTIVAIDVKSLQVLEAGEKHDNYAFVLYDGIHYDCFAVKSETEEENQTVFSSEEKPKILEECIKLATKLQQTKQFTDTKNFDLRCITCGEGLVGQSEALEHAKATGHGNFTEY